MEDTKKETIKNLIVILVGALIIVGMLLINAIFKLATVHIVVICWIVTTLFAIWIILIVDPKVTINPVHTIVKEVPVERQVFIDRPVEKQVFVDRPVIVEKEVIKEVPTIVYRTTPHKKLDIPKYDFVGSTQTKTYHKRNCKFSKLIKNKYKLHSNSASTFKSKHFKACKGCINK